MPPSLHRHVGSFERLCFLPQQINRCLDWDLSDTRWQRVGLTLAQAYATLGLRVGSAPTEVCEEKAPHGN